MPMLNRTTRQKGFIALVSVILLALGVLTFSVTVLAAAAEYADMVSRHELRIQRGLNEKACADTLGLMIAKDAFLNGTVELPEFGCVATVRGGAVSDISVHFP